MHLEKLGNAREILEPRDMVFDGRNLPLLPFCLWRGALKMGLKVLCDMIWGAISFSSVPQASYNQEGGAR